MSEQTNPIISFKNFSFQYRAQKKPTLHDINLDIYPGERVLIAGPSGSGKSTLAACINGLNPFANPGACTGTLPVAGVDAPHSSIFELSAHVGTDLLRGVITSIRKEIEALGGEVHFNTALTGFEQKNGRLTGIFTTKGSFACEALVFAVGHSARDTFGMLMDSGLVLECKPFSVGFRA